MTESGRVLEDQRFRGQIRDSAAGPPRNISEGFGRFQPAEFANYLRFAKASHMETQNHLRHGRTEKYFSEEDFQKALLLSKRALGAMRGLQKYLRSCNGRVPWEQQTKTKPKNREPKEPRERREPREPKEPY